MDDESHKLLDFIKTRQCIRKYTSEPISKEIIEEILECGKWTPSGLNNQPWNVLVVQDQEKKESLSKLTHYGNIIKGANVCLVVFLDIEKGYNRVKDIQALGAFMQNLLLGAHALNLGAVWLGEILNKNVQVNELFGLEPSKYELMGVIALGMTEEKLKDFKSRKRNIIKEFTEWM